MGIGQVEWMGGRGEEKGRDGERGGEGRVGKREGDVFAIVLREERRPCGYAIEPCHTSFGPVDKKIILR
jgi:hypothetical protein